ncbi:MAG: type IV pilus modification protein PilV [Proteobacteria bacterium]|uniref:type IV pilus modification protein PilV n=1 Tax=Aquabacterium sp. TaxID=1872578 RepID=UPI0035C6A3DC|nr:type IV pilus modification protein PilV [Pseudomonadota bacterium]
MAVVPPSGLRGRVRLAPRARGVTLVEVLVSMLILALGMVSLAALQGYTLRYQMGSAQRAQLSSLLSDYAERVRANVLAAPGVPGASANSPYLLSDTWATQAAAATPAIAKDCGGTGAGSTTCSAEELAAYDMAQWRAAVRRELPRGGVRVAGSALTGLTVTFMWADKDFGDGGSAGFTSRTSPRCDPATMSGLALQTCCPDGALGGSGATAGVRCANFTVIP